MKFSKGILAIAAISVSPTVFANYLSDLDYNYVQVGLGESSYNSSYSNPALEEFSLSALVNDRSFLSIDVDRTRYSEQQKVDSYTISIGNSYALNTESPSDGFVKIGLNREIVNGHISSPVQDGNHIYDDHGLYTEFGVKTNLGIHQIELASSVGMVTRTRSSIDTVFLKGEGSFHVNDGLSFVANIAVEDGDSIVAKSIVSSTFGLKLSF